MRLRIGDWDLGIGVLGIWTGDCSLGLGMGMGLVIGNGDCEWGLEMGIKNGDREWGLGVGIEIGHEIEIGDWD